MDCRRIFLFLIFLGVFARVVSFALLPEAAYSDALYHLSIAEEMSLSGSARVAGALGGDMSTPLYPLAVATMKAISNLGITSPAMRLMPVMISLGAILLAFVLFRELFPKNYLLPFSMFMIMPWPIRYGAVNYPENLGMLALLLALYAIVKAYRSREMRYCLIAALAVAALALIKLTTLLLLIVFVPALLITSARMPKKLGGILLVFLLVFAVGAWFASAQGAVTEDAAAALSLRTEAKPMFSPSVFFSGSYLWLFDSPSPESLSRIPWLHELPVAQLQLLFGLAVLPLAVLFLLGFAETTYSTVFKQCYQNSEFWCTLKRFAFKLWYGVEYVCQKPASSYRLQPVVFDSPWRGFFGLLVLAVVAVSAIPALQSPFTDYRMDVIYVRHLIPVMPLFAVLAGFACLRFWQDGSTRHRNCIRYAVLGSLLIYGIYVVCYASASALFYSSVYASQEPVYSYLSEIPEDLNVFTTYSARAVSFYTDKNAFWAEDFDLNAPAEFYAQLKGGSFNYLMVSCYREALPLRVVSELESMKLAEFVLGNDCSRLYRIR